MSADTPRVVFSVVSGSLALCFNSLLAIIILITKCFYIGKYKYLLFLYTISAAMYSVGQITTAASFLMLPNGYVFYDSVRILPVTLGNVAVNMYVYTFVQIFVILTLSFIYRYFVICNPQGLEAYIRNWTKIGLLSIAITTYVVGIMVFAWLPSPMSEEVFGDGFYRTTGYHISTTAYNGAIFFYNGSVNGIMLFALGSFSIFISASVGIILAVALKTTRKLKTISMESPAMASYQKKIFTLLIFQISFPVLFNILPIQFALVSVFFQLPTGWLVRNVGCVLTIAQIVDPLLIFYFIKPYQTALWRRMSLTRVSSTGDSQTGPHQRRACNAIGQNHPI